MLPEKLISQMERNCSKIIFRAEQQFQQQEITNRRGDVDRHKLRAWARHLLLSSRTWMKGEQHDAIARDASAFGCEAARALISLAEIIRALNLLKHSALDHMRGLFLDQSAFEIYTEDEFEYSFGLYFDFITYHLVCGYEHEWREEAGALPRVYYHHQWPHERQHT